MKWILKKLFPGLYPSTCCRMGGGNNPCPVHGSGH